MSNKRENVDSYWTRRRGIKQAMSLALEELERSLSRPTDTQSDLLQIERIHH